MIPIPADDHLIRFLYIYNSLVRHHQQNLIDWSLRNVLKTNKKNPFIS